MPGIGQIDLVDDDDVTSLFNCTDAAGANPWGVITNVRNLKLGRPQIQTDRFEPSSSDGIITTFDRETAVQAGWEQMFLPPSGGIGYDGLQACMDAFQQTLRRGGRMRFTPEGSTRTRWYDYEVPDDLPQLFGEDDDDSFRAVTSHAFPRIPVTILRQPWARLASLDPTVNCLTNWSLWLSTAVAGRPDNWTWSSTTNITAESANAATESYTFTIATAASRILRSDRYTGVTGWTAPTPAAGQTWTGQLLFAWASGNNARMRVIIESIKADDTVLQTNTGNWFTLPTTRPANPIGVTMDASNGGATMPALTAKVRIGFEFQNLDATAVTVHLAYSQLARESTPSLIRHSAATVAEDPAVSGGRVYVAYIHGSRRALGIYRRKIGAGKLQSIRIGKLSNRGVVGRNSLVDFVNGGKVIQAEAYTSKGTGVSEVADANASGSGNNALEIDYATAPTSLERRGRWEQATFVASRKGTWDIGGRFKPNTFPSLHIAQLRTGLSSQDPCSYTYPEVPLDFTKVAAGATSGYIDKILGRIYVGDPGGVDSSIGVSSTLTYELWTRLDSGSGTLRFDHFFHMPADDISFQALVKLGLASNEFWLGSQLLLGSAISSHSGAAGVDGTVTQGGLMNLNANNEATATPPAGGHIYGTGRQLYSAVLTTYRSTLDGAKIGELRIRDVTAGTDVKTIDINGVTSGAWSGMHPVNWVFDGVAGHAYQAQVWKTVANSDVINVKSIAHQVAPYGAAGEYFRMDPARYVAEHLDTNGSAFELLTVDGKTPMVLEPGPNVLVSVGADLALPNFYDGESVLGRTPVDDLTYAPCYFE